MADIRVPTLGESVTEATIGRWFKQAGEAVAVDEPVVELETDKVTIEVPAPAAGVLADIAVKDGETVAVGALLGHITEGAAAAPTASWSPSRRVRSEPWSAWSGRWKISIARTCALASASRWPTPTSCGGTSARRRRARSSSGSAERSEGGRVRERSTVITTSCSKTIRVLARRGAG